MLGARIDGGGGVVEHQHPRVGEGGTGQRDALTLTTRQGEATLPDHRAVPLRHPRDEPVRLGGYGGALDVGIGGVRLAEGDVVPDRGGEQEALLEDQPDAVAYRLHGAVADVAAVDAHHPRGGVVEPRQQQRQGRLPRPRGADDGDALAALDPQRHVGQDRLDAVVGEVHVLQLDRADLLPQHHRIRLVLHRGSRRQHVEDPSSTSPGLLASTQDARQEPDRGDQLLDVAGEREEDTQGDVVLHDQPPTKRQYADLRQTRERVQRRREGRDDAGRPQTRLEQHARLALEGGLLLRLLAEGLHHTYAGDGLLHDARDRGLIERVGVAGREGLGPEPRRNPDEHRHDHHHHQREQRGEVEHHPQSSHQQGQVSRRNGQLLQEHLDHRQVAGRPRHQIPGTEPVTTRRVQKLQMMVDQLLQITLAAYCGLRPHRAA